MPQSRPDGAPDQSRDSLGKYAATGHAEGPPFDDDPSDIDHNDYTPIAMADLGIAKGKSMYLSDFETGDAMFDQLEIRHTESGYEASGMIPVDLFNELPGEISNGEYAVPDPYLNLNDREPDINNFLRDRYGAELQESNPEWDEQAVRFTVPMADSDTTADLITRLRNSTQAADLHNDLSGAYDPSRSGGFYGDLRQTLAQQDTERQEAFGAYTAAAMWTAADQNGDSLENDHEETDIDPASLAEQREQLIDFMRTNRALLAQAAEVRPGFLDASQIAHDFHLTRNGHGAGFWDRGLGEIGDQLSDAAKGHGSAELYAGSDGKLYFG